MFLELMFFGAGYLLFSFKVPERFAKKTKFVQLYLTGYILFQLSYLNLIFEAHTILYDLLKLNSGNFDEDEDDWYRLSNLFHKD
jgi:hypothetical protein